MNAPKSKTIPYKGEYILLTAGYYWHKGMMYKTLKKAKIAVVNGQKFN